MNWKQEDYTITDDNNAADIDFIWETLQKTYWAEGRSRDVVEKSVRNSILFSIFKNDEPVGYARVVSDGITFAWICDVFILPDYRGHGLGKWLMKCCLEHPSTKVNINLLATRDAHGLYEQYGFKQWDCMVLRGNQFKGSPALQE